MPAGCAWSQFGSRYAASRLPAGAELRLEADRAQVRDQRRVAGRDVGADESDAIVAKDASVGERLQLVAAVEYLARKRIERLVPGWLGRASTTLCRRRSSADHSPSQTRTRKWQNRSSGASTPRRGAGRCLRPALPVRVPSLREGSAQSRSAHEPPIGKHSPKSGARSGDDREEFAEAVSLTSRTDLYADQVDAGLEEASGRAQVVEDAVLVVLRRQRGREEEHVLSACRAGRRRGRRSRRPRLDSAWSSWSTRTSPACSL